MAAIGLFLIGAPHLALIAAWVFWARSLSENRMQGFRSILLFMGLLACSLNIANFWTYAYWLRSHQTDPTWWMGRDRFESLSDCLLGFAVLAALIGEGRARVPVCIAGVLGWCIWIIGHLAVL
jgi:hypothetical protein